MTAVHDAAAEVFRCIGHPTRVHLLELLCERDHAVHELVDLVGATASNVSHQLGLLRRSGLVGSTRRAGSVVYRLEPPHLRECLARGDGLLQTLAAERVRATQREPAAAVQQADTLTG